MASVRTSKSALLSKSFDQSISSVKLRGGRSIGWSFLVKRRIVGSTFGVVPEASASTCCHSTWTTRSSSKQNHASPRRAYV